MSRWRRFWRAVYDILESTGADLNRPTPRCPTCGRK